MSGITSVSGAFGAYQKAKANPGAAIRTEEKPAAQSFGDLIDRTVRDTVDTVRAGDRAAVAGLKGEMSTQQVVEATMAMESALQVTVAVRDKVLEAYQEVLRMAV